ncbi:MAG: hypothetical protein ACI8Z1_001669 [Candidatus Azotimanducaceae bacterium]|jgi:hypothetical protein
MESLSKEVKGKGGIAKMFGKTNGAVSGVIAKIRSPEKNSNSNLSQNQGHVP